LISQYGRKVEMKRKPIFYLLILLFAVINSNALERGHIASTPMEERDGFH
jgi:hypothetical protein